MNVSRKLLTFAFVADQFAKTSDIARGLLPLFGPVIAKRAGTKFVPDQFVRDVRETYDIEMHPYVAEELSHKLADAGFLTQTFKNDSHVEFENKAVGLPEPPIPEAEIVAIIESFAGFATAQLKPFGVSATRAELEGAFLDRIIQQDFLGLILKPDSTTARPSTLTLKQSAPATPAAPGVPATATRQQLDYLVSRFILNMAQARPDDVNKLVSMASGALVAEVVLDLQSPSTDGNAFAGLQIAVDSPLILNALDLGHDGTTHYSELLLQSMRKAGAKPVAFEYTVAEVERAIRSPLTNYERNAEVYGVLGRKLRNVSTFAPYVRAFLPTLRESIEKMGITILPYSTIDRARDRTFFTETNEGALGESIGEYERHEAREHDAMAVADILRIRGSRAPNSIKDAGIVFVTRNARLARLSRRFLREEALSSADYFPPCVTDRHMAGLLWISTGGGGENLYRLRLIANCTAAVLPRRDVVTKMHGFMTQLEPRMADRFEALMTNERAEHFLMDRTLGDTRLITSNNFEEIYKEVEEIAAERVTEKKNAELAEQRETNERKLADLHAAASEKLQTETTERLRIETQLASRSREVAEHELARTQISEKLGQRELRLVEGFRDAGNRAGIVTWACIILAEALLAASLAMVTPTGTVQKIGFAILVFIAAVSGSLLGNKKLPGNRLERFIDKRRESAAWRLAEKTNSAELLSRYEIDWRTGIITRQGEGKG